MGKCFRSKIKLENLEISPTFSGMFRRATMVFIQFVLAAIMLIWIAEALLERMNFNAWRLFVLLWTAFSSTITTYILRCLTRFLFEVDIKDYSGGYAIHLSPGVAGFIDA
ncbi:hypothetical protein ACLOJK_011123 [Asimina triloba]